MLASYLETLLETGVSSLDLKTEKALSFLSKLRGTVVALSAGVDSSLVAFLAYRALQEKAIAATGVSESLPPGELEEAKKTAEHIGIEHVIVPTNELRLADYASNPVDRCYYCKNTLYRELRILADRLHLEAIVDGTHADDLEDDRPGLRAAREAGVKSPLLEAGFVKQDVRDAARLFGLPVWDKPAMPCLSSRVVHGEKITEEKLAAIGQAELFIKSLTGVRNLRVRYRQSQARIEVPPPERRVFFDENVMDRIDRELRRLGFSEVTLDLRGYVSKQQSSSIAVLLPLADDSRGG